MAAEWMNRAGMLKASLVFAGLGTSTFLSNAVTLPRAVERVEPARWLQAPSLPPQNLEAREPADRLPLTLEEAGPRSWSPESLIGTQPGVRAESDVAPSGLHEEPPNALLDRPRISIDAGGLRDALASTHGGMGERGPTAGASEAGARAADNAFFPHPAVAARNPAEIRGTAPKLERLASIGGLKGFKPSAQLHRFGRTGRFPDPAGAALRAVAPTTAPFIGDALAASARPPAALGRRTPSANPLVVEGPSPAAPAGGGVRGLLAQSRPKHPTDAGSTSKCNTCRGIGYDEARCQRNTNIYRKRTGTDWQS